MCRCEVCVCARARVGLFVSLACVPCLSVCQPVSVCQAACCLLVVCLSVCLFVCLSVRLSFRLPVCLPVCRSACRSRRNGHKYQSAAGARPACDGTPEVPPSSIHVRPGCRGGYTIAVSPSNIHTHTHTHTHIHTYMHAYTHTHAHTNLNLTVATCTSA